jgi:hypothetical protein
MPSEEELAKGVVLLELLDRFSGRVTTAQADFAIKSAGDAVRYAVAKCNQLIPDGREKSLFNTKMEEAFFWARAGIERACPPKREGDDETDLHGHQAD